MIFFQRSIAPSFYKHHYEIPHMQVGHKFEALFVASNSNVDEIYVCHRFVTCYKPSYEECDYKQLVDYVYFIRLIVR